MEFKTQQSDSANAQVTGVISKEDIDNSINKIAKELSKTANIPGFRKGKVPVSAVKQQYGEKLVQDAESEALRGLVNAAIEELKLEPAKLIGEPQLTKFDKQEVGSIEVEVALGIRPSIELGEYRSFVPEVSVDAVSDEDVEKRILELGAHQAPTKEVEEDRALVNGDIAVIDFEGFIDGEAFEGGKAEDFHLTLGSGQFIPGFEAQVEGLKKGESKDVNVDFPAEYQAKELAGKPAVFKVTVKSIEEKEAVEINDELAKKMLQGDEEASVEKLKEQTKTQLENEAKAKLYNEDLKPNLIKSLVKEYSFDLPNFVVEQEIDIAVNKKAREMKEEELNELKDNEEKIKELRESCREEAQENVKATFLVDALAAKEEVSVAKEEVMQTIYFEALQMGQDPKAVFEQYEKSGYIPAIQMAMVEDRLLTKLLDEKLEAK